jgi:hypothetical protein
VTDEERKEKAVDRYHAACHAMQSGVAMRMEQELGGGATAPKHLRVGINSAMVETSTIVQILIDRGLLTELEWYERLADAMEAEVQTYERLIGKGVKLA